MPLERFHSLEQQGLYHSVRAGKHGFANLLMKRHLLQTTHYNTVSKAHVVAYLQPHCQHSAACSEPDHSSKNGVKFSHFTAKHGPKLLILTQADTSQQYTVQHALALVVWSSDELHVSTSHNYWFFNLFTARDSQKRFFSDRAEGAGLHKRGERMKGLIRLCSIHSNKRAAENQHRKISSSVSPLFLGIVFASFNITDS